MDETEKEQKRQNAPSNANNPTLILRIRLVLATLLTTATLLPQIYQPALDHLWQYLLHSNIYTLSTFETLWTVFLYALIEVPLTALFIAHPEWRLSPSPPHRSKPKGMKRPSRRGWEALVYVAPLLAMDLLMVKKFSGVGLEAMLRSGNYDPEVELLGAQHRETFLVPSLHRFSLDSPLQTRRALPLSPPSSRRLVLELGASLALYDLLFFLFHLALHTLPLVRHWHRPHHTHTEMHPQITNQLSVFERLGLVLLANFSLNILGSHVLTRTLFVPVFVWLLVEIHCGMEVPWGYEKVLPEGWGGGARKHARHHGEGTGGLEPYFNWCDAVWEGLTREEGKSESGHVDVDAT